jgi:hypothetical protein
MSVTTLFLIFMAVIIGVSVFGAIVWAVIHVARGKFHEQYAIATEKDVEKRKKGSPRS